MPEATPLQPLRGFRDFYPQDCALRNYVFSRWREVCRLYGFTEVEGPLLEPTGLYRKKSGEEVVEQLFAFTDKGGREVSLRPELTPTLARMVAARQRDYRKPLRWFSIGQFFRYEKQQVERGRLREFYQLNCDLLGDESPAADAELIALSIDLLRAFGLGPDAFRLRLSDRQVWIEFIASQGILPEQTEAFLQIVDKLDRESPQRSEERLAAFGLTLDVLKQFMVSGPTRSSRLDAVLQDLRDRGLDGFVEVDLGVVRGLAYYTGLVFELFDLRHGLRAIAGGGRYDQLVALLSDGQADLPAVGIGMGDVVLSALIEKSSETKAGLCAYLSDCAAIDVFVVIAAESSRSAAAGLIQALRESGLAVHYPFSPAKVAKQFQAAEQSQARVAVIAGSEFPEVRVKNLATRQEEVCQGTGDVLRTVRRILDSRDQPLLA
ncbi:MAG TPA: histidine--tRNA ligase [Verrucomicrobiales bacterium]|nr:histidine--tRNA ligase [Verrucomicrobiales bacterium]